MTKQEALDYDVTELTGFLDALGIQNMNHFKTEHAIPFGERFFNQFERTATFDTMRKQIYPYLLQNLNVTDITTPLYKIPYILIYATHVGDEILDVLKELYDVDNIDDRRITMYSMMFGVREYMNLHNKNYDFSAGATTIVELFVRFMLYHCVKASISDKPVSTIDFKRALMSTFIDGQNHNTLQTPQFSRAFLFMMLSNYLYTFDKSTGEKILNGTYIVNPEKASWNDERKFLLEMEEKIKNDDVARSEFIDDVAFKMLRNMPEALSDRIQGQKFDAHMEDVFAELEIHDYEYNYTLAFNHASNMFSALRYYVDKMNPEIKEILLSEYSRNRAQEA